MRLFFNMNQTFELCIKGKEINLLVNDYMTDVYRLLTVAIIQLFMCQILSAYKYNNNNITEYYLWVLFVIN